MPEELPVKIVCLLKSGGCYTPDYVDRLYNGIKRNTTIPFRFICITDMIWEHPSYISLPLINDWPGWWSKIQFFLSTGKVVSVDLDTLIIDNVDDLLRLPDGCGQNQFYMMKAPNPKRTYTSSVMAWNGDFAYIYGDFVYAKREHEWDQFYILKKLEERDIKILPIQDNINGIYSYKRQWLPDKPKSRIIWFHGKPRVHRCKDSIIDKHWI
jgi:hypothetical protein